MFAALTLAALASTATAVDPPVWPNTFSQRFVETFNVNNQSIHVTGEHWYDAPNNRSRLDRKDGLHDPLCQTFFNTSTPCTNLVVGSKRYVVFPEKKYGCFCCDAAHGCGILRPNWLENATYVGQAELLGQTFYKWSKPDGPAMDYYYATVDSNRIPRRLEEGTTHEVDYLMNTYSTAAIPSSVFDVPSYVSGDCPDTSRCSRFRSPVVE